MSNNEEIVERMDRAASITRADQADMDTPGAGGRCVFPKQ